VRERKTFTKEGNLQAGCSTVGEGKRAQKGRAPKKSLQVWQNINLNVNFLLERVCCAGGGGWGGVFDCTISVGKEEKWDS